ncbi:hypothetical protein HOD38_02230 [archaeon]|jgi:hypothetical protein|nr:hypothetical protein [archaeon]MBT4397059.1 hypothetical protein [archaeon]MBT4441049.1 hypothetical protein [archaeon]
MNKKGLDISLNFVIIAALALIALIVIALIFTGGIQKLIGQEEEVIEVGTQEFALAEGACSLACSAGSETAWDNPSFPQSVIDAGYDSCDDMLDTTFETCDQAE